MLPPMFKTEVFGLAVSTTEYLEAKGEANMTQDSVPATAVGDAAGSS